MKRPLSASRLITHWLRSIPAPTSGRRTPPPQPSAKRPSRDGALGRPSRAAVNMQRAHGSILWILSILTAAVVFFPMRRSFWQRTEPEPAAVVGEVHAAHGPIAGARVRLQGTPQAVWTDARGHFHLPLA